MIIRTDTKEIIIPVLKMIHGSHSIFDGSAAM